MKSILTYSLLFILLLCGGENALAAVRNEGKATTPTHHISKKQSKKVKEADQFTVLVEDIDIDVEEEHSQTGDHSYKLIPQKHSLSATWNPGFSRKVILGERFSRYNTFPVLSGKSTPIYITNRVLRI
jgi:hypothetical protein